MTPENPDSVPPPSRCVATPPRSEAKDSAAVEAGPGGDDAVRRAQTAWREHRDESAASWLVSHLTPLLHSIALRSLPQPWMAEDAVQTMWMNLFRSLEAFDGRVPFSAWAVCLLKNVCANVRRSWHRRAGLFPSGTDGGDRLDDRERSSFTPPLGDVLMAREDLRSVIRRIRRLPESDRAIVDVIFMGSGSAQDAAARTGLTPGAVRVRAHRIRAELRAVLAA